ncbi:cytochrome c oxidase assembly factor Coa1 family protein [Flavobacterium sp. KACC 22763]|uniref:cytochrome c oxidase assembly factor Coa1 family protein n=1 Tax=Flavobacterium sp. KACC 22763 TaxID=3025668 RepID=UPI002365B469|nr:cytochrome c oxidase assembly factor Coa1 family protein [Flavobacterium sp. KACC 22763]WDF64768.1 cytochrome c oxidase assembly factor Coa1 family protein [Flavobacterium sp. KACC 22763]
MEDSNQLIQKQSWLNRNWKWLIPSGCLTLLLLAALFIGGIFYEVTSVLKDSEAYKESMIAVENNKLVVEKLGSPVETDGMVSGTVTSHNDVRTCDVQVPLKGPKGKATLFVVGEKRGKWKYSEMSVYIENTKEKIDLLQK